MNVQNVQNALKDRTDGRNARHAARPDRARQRGCSQDRLEGTSKDKKAKKKSKKNIQNGIVYIQATFNNTLITITDVTGNVLSWSSAGARGFKGSRKSTPFAAQVAAGDAAAKAMGHGLKYLRRERPGRRTRVGAARIASAGLKVIADPRHHAHPPQRLPAAEAPSRLLAQFGLAFHHRLTIDKQ